jgi:hypothetical protein
MELDVCCGFTSRPHESIAFAKNESGDCPVCTLLDKAEAADREIEQLQERLNSSDVELKEREYAAGGR